MQKRSEMLIMKGRSGMKILVLSDTHGRRDLVKKCIEQHPDVQAVLHLGDIVSDFNGMEQFFPDKKFFCVRGNCDYGSDVPAERLVRLGGTLILMTHGHLHGVNYSTTHLVGIAAQKHAKIALYGHTHVPYNMYHDGIYVLNPGSLAFPRDCNGPSYGLIEITPKGILTNTAKFNQFLKV